MGELWQEAYCSFLDTLQRFDYGERKSSQERFAVVKAGDDECLDQELCCFPHEEGPDPADVVESESAGSGHCSDVGSATQMIVQDHAEVPHGGGTRYINALNSNLYVRAGLARTTLLVASNWC